MDTRNKIVNAAEAAKEHGALVRGFFDPLSVAHVRRLEALASDGPVTILLESPQRPLLPVAARAELLAALRVVKQVVIVGDKALPEFQDVPVTDESGSDLSRLQELMEHVKRRQNAG